MTSPGPCPVFQVLNRIGPALGTRCGPGSGPDVVGGMITAWLPGIEFEETMKTQAAPEAVHARA